VLTSEAKY